MTPTVFREARARLGLSVVEMAAMLGVQPTHVRRMEMAPGHTASRVPSPTTQRLVQAYLDGYRPADWPHR